MTDQLIERLIERNAEQSGLYTDPGITAKRRRYRTDHPTEVAAFYCMDGRLKMNELTGGEVPTGIILPVRNIGAIFDLGWSALKERMERAVEYAISRGKQNLFLVTYHFSIGEKHRGCRGHNYEVSAAQESALRLIAQIERVFGKGHEQVHPVLFGIETDRKTFILHDRSGGRRAVMLEHVGADDQRLLEIIRELHPTMPKVVANDFLPFLRGNVAHVAAATGKTPVDLDHVEDVLCVGRGGSDWLDQALVVDDDDPELDDAVAKAAGIIRENRDADRISRQGGVLIGLSSYAKLGYQRAGAIEVAQRLTRLSMDAIKRHQPDMDGFFTPVTGIVYLKSRKLEIIES
jgi:hypothetical protein